MTRPLRDVAARADLLLAALPAALAGAGPALAPYAPETSPPAHPAGVPDDVALVVATSGSTGEPRHVMLTAAALRASAAATGTRLRRPDAADGPAHWLLALPAHHVAGLQVLVRSVLAGTTPTVLPDGPFRAEAFVAATAAMPAEGRRTSLVPTQLARVLDDPAATDALLTFDAVLVGGAATAPALLDRARAAGARVVTTYGMSETCGGCVYDGVPLDGVSVRLDDDRRVLLAGDVLAAGYLGRPDLDAQAFEVRDGRRWLRTSDVGRLAGSVLAVLGRADDVIVTGGAKVAPAAVEAVLADLGLADAHVVGVPDDEWGEAVVAVVAAPVGTPAVPLDELRPAVAAVLGTPAAPAHLVVVDTLPVVGPGKVDRRALAALAAAATAHAPRGSHLTVAAPGAADATTAGRAAAPPLPTSSTDTRSAP